MYYGSIKYNQSDASGTKHDNALLAADPSSSRRHTFRCSVKVFLSTALILALLSIIGVSTSLDEDHWLFQAWELGYSGYSAQKIAHSSLIHKLSSSDDKLFELEQKRNSRHNKHKTDIQTIVPDGCESTVMLIRHCEKRSLKSHCNFIGYERAAYLATIFGDGDTAKWPAPFKLYALGAARKHGKVNYREVETVKGIADKINKGNHKNETIVINQKYSTKNHKQLASEILHNIMQGKMCGKLALVSWKHSDLPKLASLLGCGPLEGCPLDYKGRMFDVVFEIKFIYKAFHDTRDDILRKAHWKVFGNIQNEQFDPLAFSKSVGDYPARTEKNQTDPAEMLHWKTDNTTLYEEPTSS
eukprot:CAMPEP_0194258920 /NCGR_PEP_ID=MMETSP0158-20130606/42378_1 /TAXON_ID=33649 /ORGANISM="Thalassionema nitzschioides, Strain L26-B" /LENGTH=355 /DNA_ID=CAMNT_0038998505 /DNA_START=24 /DNA_END=1091 /DNA_ORIENTATION=-